MARTTRKSGKKTVARRKTAKRTSTKAKRSAAAKKAARTRAANKRKRSAAAKKAAATRKRNSRKTAKRSSSKRKTTRSTTSKAKRSRAAKKAWATRRRNASKRSRAAKRGASKRKSSKRKPATRRKARRTTTKPRSRRTSKAKRSRAAKKGWATRKRNSGRRGARRTSKRRTSRRRTSKRRSSKMFGMKLPKMNGLKGGLRTLMMGGVALGLVGALVYFPLNLVSGQTASMVNSVSSVVNKLPISGNNAQDIITLGTGVLTLAVGGMILSAAKRRKMFSSKTQNMLPTALVLGTSAYTISKLQTANIGAAFNQVLMGKPVEGAKTLNQGAGYSFSSMIGVNRSLPTTNNTPLPNNGGGTQNLNGARRLGLGSSIYGGSVAGHMGKGHGHMGSSNALYNNNSANAGRIFGARLGSAKRKVNLF